MDITTTFLLVFIFSMLLGNLLLYFIGKDKLKQNQKNTNVNDKELENFNNVEPYNLSGKLSANESKLILAYKRIQELENEIKQLKTKIAKLEDFRVTGSTEIIGLKEAIEDLKSFSNGKIKKTKKQKENSEKIPEKEIHKLIYRSV